MRHSSNSYGDLTAVHVFQFNFFFCIFAAIAGSDGETSLEGATAMDNMSFTSLKTGLDEIEKLQDNERDIYDNYLISRATMLGLQFDEDAQQGVRKGDAKTALQRAIVRLSCMCKCKDGVAVCGSDCFRHCRGSTFHCILFSCARILHASVYKTAYWRHLGHGDNDEIQRVGLGEKDGSGKALEQRWCRSKACFHLDGVAAISGTGGEH